MTSLRRANAADIERDVMKATLERMGIGDKLVRRRIAKQLLGYAMPRFAQILETFDGVVAEKGFAAGVRWLLPYLRMSVSVEGIENVPTEGPVLLASNHPGSADFLAIFSNLPRDDVRLVAAIEQLDLLPNVLPHIIYTSGTRGKKKARGATTQKMIGELLAGHCILIYPRGIMEPEPRWVAGSRETLTLWSDSMSRFAEAVPDLTIIPTVVSGSVTRKAIERRWLSVYRSERARQRVATFVQLAMSMIRPRKWHITPHVQFGKPVRASEVGLHGVRPHVMSEMNRMLTWGRAPEWPIRTGLHGWLDKKGH